MKTFDTKDFDALILKLASPEKVQEWSYGEVTRAETINYRTGRAERGGLFDERIFGPTKDYECYCGKYRRVRYKNIVCEKCGVEVTRYVVRRDRMGHIELAAPVAHIWFVRGVPSRIGLLLNLSLADVEKVVYFAGYIITDVNEEELGRVCKDLEAEYKSKLKLASTKKDKEKLKELFANATRDLDGIKVGRVVDEMRYHTFAMRFGSAFTAAIGSEAIYDSLKKIDLEKLRNELEEGLLKASAAERTKLYKRLGVVRSMLKAGIRPEWMLLTHIPILPPALRPMVPLDGGRHATSDVNDLYRRVINRNNRLKKLKEVNAPEVILRNEKRILQEAVDSLIDNAMRHGSAQAFVSMQKRELKSLSEGLKGKQGFFRQNLLGKRVDYSGRSVIVVGPNLRLSQCGLPKHMALELFRPFVISKILEQELAFNIRGANRLIEEGVPEVWAILEEVIKGKYVLLNRAPTLHRLGIQAFQPVLIEGHAIELHPLVCPAFNADFDGDQMAVHVPLSDEAQWEARELMAAPKNILKPGSGDPVLSSKMLDILLGCFWVTKIMPGKKGDGKIFPSPNMAITAYDFDDIDLRAHVKVLGTESPKYESFGNAPFETTVGRLLFNSILPRDYPYVNKEVDRKVLSEVVDNMVEQYGFERTVQALDKMKDFGFRYATRSGITWGIDSVRVPEKKQEIIAESLKAVDRVNGQHDEGLLSAEEKYRKVIEIWQSAKMQIEELVPETLNKDGSVHDMLHSGARGSIGPLTQMAGMKGLITDTVGQSLAFPVISSYKEGLSPIEYFITTHGSRYGLTSTALQTAKAGYLTRRLVDVAQDSIITEEDCKDKGGKSIRIQREDVSDIEMPLNKVIGGRILAKDAVASDGTVVMAKGEIIRRADVERIVLSGVFEVNIRTPLTCKTVYGLCRYCYGTDLGRNQLVELGEAVGVVAAQAIGEPGTQLTMRTFHKGGVAEEDITTGLPRVEELFERRPPKNPAVVSEIAGSVLEVKEKGRERSIVILPGEGVRGKGAKKKGEVIEYAVPMGRTPIVTSGADVERGDVLTDGSVDLSELFKYAGREATEEYIIREISKIYSLQGEHVSRKHIEVILRQMFSRRRIKSPGDTRFALGELAENLEFSKENERAKEEKGEEAKGETVILGISEVALSTQSFLSAASFQNTTRILIKAALRGAKDSLRGLKENVIIGRIIPAGTGFHIQKKRAEDGLPKEEKEESAQETA